MTPDTDPTPSDDASWDARMDALWQQVDRSPEAWPPGELVRCVDELAATLPAADARALFERACARDTAGLEAEAEPLYRAALAAPGLDDFRAARARLQLGSTLRHLGRLQESEALLRAQLDAAAADGTTGPLQDEARALLAFTWLAQGRSVAAACLALETLAPHLSRYRRSLAANAREMARVHGESLPRPPGTVR